MRSKIFTRSNPCDLSIIVVSFNTQSLLLDCVNSVANKTRDIDYEIIVVDNGSRDDSVIAISRLNLKLIINKGNRGFAAANNQGMKVAKGRYILLLNSDTLILDNVLAEMVSWMDKNPEVGIASCALKNKDGSYQGTGGYFPTLIRVFSWMTIQDFPFVDFFIKPFHPTKEKSFTPNLGFYQKEKELDWVTGAFFFIRKEVLDEIGFLDEDYFMYVEEVDYCFRAKKKGWKVWYWPQKAILHHGAASGGTEAPLLQELENIKLFYKKHFPSWQYPLLRLLLKVGALGRMILFALLGKTNLSKIYAKAFVKV